MDNSKLKNIQLKDTLNDIYNGPIFRTGENTFTTKNKGEFEFIFGVEDTDHPLVKKISDKCYNEKTIDKEELLYTVTLYKTKANGVFYFEY